MISIIFSSQFIWEACLPCLNINASAIIRICIIKTRKNFPLRIVNNFYLITSSSFAITYSDLLVPYESGLDSIESTKTIYYHCIRLSFLRPHIAKRSEGKKQWANAKNFIFLFLSLTYTKEERCFYRVLEKFFYFCAKKIAIRLHFLKSYSFAINNI